MSLWYAYFFTPVSAARAFLLERLVLLMLAFDAWILMIERGGRYGAGGFNVAHFAWLDAIAPMPTPALYVGLVLFIGLLSFVLAIAGPTRVGLVILAALYTFAWSWSMLDSYQHHYLFSLLLVCFIFFPRTEARALHVQLPGEGVAMLSATVGIVYTFTAISKTEPQWRSGEALRAITSTKSPFAPIEAWASGLGLSHEAFWSLLGLGVVLVQIVIAIGYFLAPRLGSLPRVASSAVRALALGSALSFHLGAEWLDLRIGWFSYYMVSIALLTWAPTPLLERACRPIARLSAWLAARGQPSAPTSAVTSAGEGRRERLLSALGVGVITVLLGWTLDLPGARGATIAAAIALVAAQLVPARAQDARRRAVALALGAGCLWASLTFTDVRYDFYRYLGGDSRRRGDLETALDAYLKAERYAPEGESKQDKVDELRALLRQRRD